MAKRPLATDEGETLPPLPPDSDVAQLIHLLEYARIRDFKVGPRVQIGNVCVEIQDLRQATRGKPVDDGNIWKEHGHDE